jgi:hypothetical protein
VCIWQRVEDNAFHLWFTKPAADTADATAGAFLFVHKKRVR